MTKLLKEVFLVSSLLFIVGCSTIDDDLSDCGKEVAIDYEMCLITNKEHEITTVLGGEADQPVADALRQHLSNIFTDYAHDIDLSFYDVRGDSLRLKNELRIMDATEKSYTIYLPVQEYMHLALANISQEPQVSFVDSLHCHPAHLTQADRDTLPSHNTGLFTARLPMQVMDGQDQDFHVRLYMANCGSAIVLDTTLCNYRNIRIYTTGFATGYHLCDSTYQYADTPIIRANHVPVSEGADVCYCSVNFPSPEPPDTRTITETTEPFIAPSANEDLWQYRCYVTLVNGSVTESILGLKKPLRAGQLKIIKGRVTTDGGIEVTSDAEVGVSVSLDWKPGGNYEPDL